jgi:lipopolysaccharide/colanic/teichoic acid biosynthesis glycosyltransferase
MQVRYKMKRIKRLFEILSASFLLVIFFIPSIIVCIVIYIRTNQSPVFVQLRGLTLKNRIFKIYKFRTIKDLIKPVNSYGYNYNIDFQVSEGGIYPFGSFLRKTGLDEIPQLINIVKGEMTFVGPRPLDIKDLLYISRYYKNGYKEREKIKIKPGITGWWQINKYKNGGLNHLIDSDKYYVENKSLYLDLSIIIHTVFLSVRCGNKESKLISTTNNNISFAQIHNLMEGQMN